MQAKFKPGKSSSTARMGTTKWFVSDMLSYVRIKVVLLCECFTAVLKVANMSVSIRFFLLKNYLINMRSKFKLGAKFSISLSVHYSYLAVRTLASSSFATWSATFSDLSKDCRDEMSEVLFNL